MSAAKIKVRVDCQDGWMETDGVVPEELALEISRMVLNWRKEVQMTMEELEDFKASEKKLKKQ